MRLAVIIALVALMSACEPGPRPVQQPAELDGSVGAKLRPTHEFYAELVDLDHMEFWGTDWEPFGPEHAIVTRATPHGRWLLRYATMSIEPFPRFAGNPFVGKTLAEVVMWAPEVVATFVSLRDEIVIAMLTQDRQASVKFQVLKLAQMRWDDAGELALALPLATTELLTPTLSAVDGQARVELSRGSEVFARYALDLDTLLWEPVSPSHDEKPTGPCAGSQILDPDFVRWAITGHDLAPCVAARRAEDQPWTRLDDQVRDRSLPLVRALASIDGGRVLVTGRWAGPLAREAPAHIVDLVRLQVRPVGRIQLGRRLDVPGEHVWLSRSHVQRLDLDTERFEETPIPGLDFEPDWELALDSRTSLLGNTIAGVKPRAARVGFREK